LSDLQSVADDIRGLLSCVADVQHAANRQSMRDSIVGIMKTILEANSLVDEFLKRSRIGRFAVVIQALVIHDCRPKGQFTASQFRSSLDKYRDKLVSAKEKFDRAMEAQTTSQISELGESDWSEQQHGLRSAL
jgi:hypothetical protein